MTHSESTVLQNLQGYDASQRGIEEQVSELFGRYKEVYDRLAVEFPARYTQPRVGSVSLDGGFVLLTNDVRVPFSDLIDPDRATAEKRAQLEDEIFRRTESRDTQELTELEVEFASWDQTTIDRIGRLLELRRRYPEKEVFNRIMVDLDTVDQTPVPAV